MSLLARIRRRRGSMCARTLVALFAISWMGLAVQPCVAGAGHDPPGAASHEMPAADGDQGCPHCPPAPAEGDDCGTGSALDCDGVDVPAPPVKGTDLPQWDVWAVMDLPAPPDLPPSANRLAAPTLASAVWRPPSASIQQRFCTFLK
jgi:hypothetical protein